MFLEGEMAKRVLECSGDDGNVYGIGFTPLNEMFFDFFHDDDFILPGSFGLV